ncbi:sugar ABC transporter substrate-binding protein [Erysipelothrix larvae]|uniref:Sugar ABC transporter substrate-binding protein n=1 Tax=Erysipelothrix larvae TaxID=1514105 RepID=A0A0X8H281_9FIRM|nr:multiple monosaccharide ABC transporter substrate-binding protein [Erysipelothrix larvae]AMC94514.1 sugar ABC transporter substrate-binding protein [Erysipelothrix larvae]
MKLKQSKMLVVLLMVVLMIAGCSNSGDTGSSKGFVGISMPTQSAERWISDGSNMVKILEELGYSTDLQYAEDVVEDQVSQIENMITKGVDVLVIAAVDGSALTDVLAKANEEGIRVIAYDRLLMNSEYVDYYATFDNYSVGVLQANFIIDSLDLENTDETFNIELFGGSPDDNNSLFFWDGAIDTLKPYFEDGTLVVASGQTEFNQAATLRWDGATAQTRMDNILNAHYSTGKTVDVVLSPYDPISLGVIESLKAIGYGTDELPLPLVTGQDATEAGVKSIIAGEQSQTVFKDTRKLAEKAAEMVQSLLEGTEVEINDTETYDNGAKIVPSYLLVPQSVDISNFREILIDSGYFTAADLGLE